MSRIAIPIAGQILWSTGDVRLRADINLLLRNSSGNLIPETFRVDTGSEITTFPAYHARVLDLPMPANACPGITHAQTKLEVRAGVIRFQVIGMNTTEHHTPCFFLGDPAVPPPPSPATFPRKLLQPFALVDHLRFIIDKDPVIGALYGELVVERK